MNDCGVDAAFVHQGDGLLRGKGRHLSMRQVARQAASPEVDLGVDDLHRGSPFIVTHWEERPNRSDREKLTTMPFAVSKLLLPVADLHRQPGCPKPDRKTSRRE